jgi:hypothetical protein
MYVFPKLYRTITHATWLFVCVRKTNQHYWLWQRVKKVWWGAYVADGDKFIDQPSMFYAVSALAQPERGGKG